jgi:hypothetical protein
MARKNHGASRSIAVGFRHVNDDSSWLVVFLVELALDGGEGVEKEVASESHDGGAARGDAVLGLEKKEAREEFIDGKGGLEFGETSREFGGEIGGLVAFLLAAGMPGAEGGERIGDGQAAATVAGMVLAAGIG